MNEEVKALAETIQHNCHIADAQYAGDYTLCIYLLKMREMYRWEQGENFTTTLSTDGVGDWLTEREGHWDDIESADFRALHIAGAEYDPFDNEAINRLLKTWGLVYNAGLGLRCRPHFFLAEIKELRCDDKCHIIIAGREYARDMAAPPAMAQQNRIYIRQESLRRMLWEKVEEWRMSGLDNPIGRAAAFYDFENDVEVALDEMTSVETDMIIAHELGELQASELLGDAWLDMLAALPRTHAEIMLRAVRDHLADALVTLPLLVKTNNLASIHFYFGNMTAMRKKLAPALYQAYESWHEDKNTTVLQDILPKLSQHWQNAATQALKLFAHEADPKQAANQVETMLAKWIFQ